MLGIKFGLAEHRSACAPRSGILERRYASLHIAGTNGKGSVTALVARGAAAPTGIRAARYTSPHLVDLSERFAIGGTSRSTPPL